MKNIHTETKFGVDGNLKPVGTIYSHSCTMDTVPFPAPTNKTSLSRIKI